MDPYSTIPHPGHGAGHHRSGGDTPTTIQFLTHRYMKHSKSVGILWGVFTVCSAILNIVVFLQEEWVGETSTAKSPGHFGLWRFCTVLSQSGDSSISSLGDSYSSSLPTEQEHCVGELANFGTIISPAFRAATVFVGLAVIVGVLSVISLLLFCFMKSGTVFEVCGVMQLLTGICMSIGILCFPAGWDNDRVRGICGASSNDYVLGNCGIRWAFVLAVVAVLDAWILGCLAFTLSHRHAKPISSYGGPMHISESPYMNPGSIYKGGEINGGFIGDSQSLAGSRKSLNMLHGQPVVMMPHPSATGGHHVGPGFPPPPPPFMQGGPPADMSHMSPPPPPDIYSEFSHRHGNNQRNNQNGQGGGSRNENTSSPYRNQQQHNTGNHPYGPSIQNFQL